MTGERWTRLKEVFAQALEQPPADRRAWIARACAGDDELGNLAEALLDAHDEDPGFLEQPPQVDPADIVDALAPVPPPATLAPGTVLGNGQYQVVGEIGQGGMGIVYLAQDLRLPRRVALKALPEAARHDPVRLERFRREAWAAAKVSHTAVATIFAFEEIDGQPFIVTEYVRGQSLRGLLEQGAIDPVRVRAIATDVARALAAAHEQGVVHRDLKPENILLTEEGAVKVVDFGIAQLARQDVPELTQTGAWVGTPAYMAPEQIDGRPVDARADIFSFGVVLAEMLTGQHPFRGTASSDSMSEPMGAIVRRCLQVVPSERYGSVRELLRDLGAADGTHRAAAGRGTARWWWQFHQAAAAVAYIGMAVAAWQALDDIGRLGRGAGGAFAVALLASVIVSANLRLNLWFTSRFFPDQLPRVRRQRRSWILAADAVLIATLAGAGLLLLVAHDDRRVSLLLLALAIGAAAALLLIEPVTTRAAFGEVEKWQVASGK